MNLTRTRETGQFHCPTCRSNQDYRLRSRRPFLTLYFIPVVPIGGAEQFVVCRGCKEKWDPSVLQTDAKEQADYSLAQFHEEALRSAILVVLHDGYITEPEIDSLIYISNQLLQRPVDREELGELCSIASQNRVLARNYVTTVSRRWSDDQKKTCVQAMFLAATSEGALDDDRAKLLADMKGILKMSEADYQSAVSEALQWE
ncbi:zinc-ribbon domain-containing protein [Stieleria sp. JC731]|uniref:TerB family tellurite resistance protein n=1 Tax=Pirellulaceae TaxID=2691357 RepID=UPI001E290365|nr:zinc-ribbon domain-containing protein [Stieleria sp. JC731]MCC9604123.1 zinc-ribbon domain-containing protein [Stieleria sp. JC731]